MKQATRMMLLSNGNGKKANGGMAGNTTMEQPHYNEDYVGRKVRENQMEYAARHSSPNPMEQDGRDPYSGYGMRRKELGRGQGMEHRRQPEEDDEEEYWRKPQRMYAAGMAWTDEGQGKKHGWKEYDEHRAHEEPKEVDEECAMKWVRHMKNGDGSTAPHFKPDLADQMRMAYCPECKKWEWFVAINMMYADYGNVAKKMGVDRDEYYAHMAKAFLMDEDAAPHKLAKYMEVIPKK